jgi:hypothetical protein
MKFTYRLTQQTIQAINGHAQQVAEEMDCSPKHIYSILAGTYTDPFAVFERLFAAAVRAGCDVGHWLRRLDAIRAKYYRMEPQSIETETAKSVKEFNDVVIASIEGKPIDKQLIEIDQAISQLEILRKAAISQLAAGDNLRSFARNRVEARA